LKEAIQQLVELLPTPLVTVPLYHGPSPVPIFWARLLRFLPCAVAVLWPIVRLLPRDLEDQMRVHGATPMQQLTGLVLPLLFRFMLGAAMVVGALGLGEVGAAAMRVNTPGWITFTHVLFDRLHYGVPNEVAAMCLLLVALLVIVTLSLSAMRLAYNKFVSRSSRSRPEAG
jgi:ABC-type Fe3+ transport system permease subunit